MTLPIKCLTESLMNMIAQEARTSPRQRKNYNFHEPSERVQRFLNVLQPGTYVRPHRHLRPQGVSAFEFFLVLQGAVGVLFFNDAGEVIQVEKISATGTTHGLEVGAGIFHSLIALEPDTVMFELKEGPYIPLEDKDFLQGFPLESTPESQQCLETWRKHFD